MERYGGGAIVVVDYRHEWPAMFSEERAKIADALGPLAIAIEHIGGTSVPGLGAKPIIDLLVGVHSVAEARSCCIESIEALGYAHLPEYRAWLPEQIFFRKGIPWTHHIHVMEPSHPRWDYYLLFRDYLRAHPEAVEAYATLKRNLAEAHQDDIAAYRTAKNAFVAATLAKARAAR